MNACTLAFCTLKVNVSSRPSRSTLRQVVDDPKEPVAIFWVNDRSTLELDLRQSRRANLGWRLRSFARTDRRPRPRSQPNGCIRKSRTGAPDPKVSVSVSRVERLVDPGNGGPQSRRGNQTSQKRSERNEPIAAASVTAAHPRRALAGIRLDAAPEGYARPIPSAARRIRRSPSSAK